MNRFAIARAASYDEASSLLTGNTHSLPVLKAAGMDVVDHLKEGLIEPDLLVDILGAEGGPPAPIQEHRDGDTSTIRLSALTTLAQIAQSTLLNGRFPGLAQAADSAATPQVRNVATTAGNLLQRPRCWYYRNREFDCLKKGGDRCYAVAGLNKYHAVFPSGPCHIVHPSNLAPALIAGDAIIHLTGAKRATMPIADLFHTPDRGVTSEHTLAPGEVITAISCRARPHSAFYAIKEKQSFDWPLVMACVALDLNGDRIASPRVVGGAVASVPLDLPHVAEALSGLETSDAEAIAGACELASRGAVPMSDNAYKLRLLPVAVRRAVHRALGQEDDS